MAIDVYWTDFHFNVLESAALNTSLNFRHRRSTVKDAPLVFIPEEGGKQCRPAQSISSIGFLALVVSIVNTVLQISNNINNNNNNRNNNDNSLNDNNDNTNVGNIGSMQMNMNMVMVGRQIEQFKRDKQRIKAKLKAIKMMASKSQSEIPPQEKEMKVEEDNNWTSEVKDELTQLLKDIPATIDGENDEEERGRNSLSVQSLEDFRNVLFSILRHPSSHRQHHNQQRHARSSNECSPVNNISLDCIYIGLTFIDFWMTAASTSRTTFKCLQYDFCQLGREIRSVSSRHAVLRAVENRLAEGASFYLWQQFHGNFPRLLYNSEDCGQCQ